MPSIVATVPAQHSYGFESSVLLALLGGAAFDAGRPFYPADIAEALARQPRPRALVTTPVHLKALLLSGTALPPVDLVLSATAPLSPQLAQQAESRLAGRVIEIYGCTEAGQVAIRRTTATEVWTTLAGLRIESQPSDDGQRFVVNGGHVLEATPLADQLELLDAQRFRLLGRANDLIHVAGKRSSLAHLNFHLNRIDGVDDGVFWLPDGVADGVVRLVAFVVAPSLSARHIIAALPNIYFRNLRQRGVLPKLNMEADDIAATGVVQEGKDFTWKSLLDGFAVELQRSRVGEVALVPCCLDEALEGPGVEHGSVAEQRPLDGAAPQRDPPHAVAALEPVEVPAAHEAHRLAVAGDHRADDVTFAVRDVTVDLAGVRRDVVQVLIEDRGVHLVRPLAVRGPDVHVRAVLVDPVVVEDARHQLDIVAVVPACLVVDAVEDREPVLQGPDVASQLLKVVVGAHLRSLSEARSSWPVPESLTAPVPRC
jgi:hypothetical protein